MVHFLRSIKIAYNCISHTSGGGVCERKNSAKDKWRAASPRADPSIRQQKLAYGAMHGTGLPQEMAPNCFHIENMCNYPQAATSALRLLD